jgi:hypothetical protein
VETDFRVVATIWGSPAGLNNGSFLVAPLRNHLLNLAAKPEAQAGPAILSQHRLTGDFVSNQPIRGKRGM